MFLLAARLIVMLFAGLVHEVQLIHQSAFLQQLQSAVNSDAIQFRIFIPRHLIKALRIQMLPGFIDQIQKNLPLPGEPHTGRGGRLCHHNRSGSFRHSALSV